MLDEVFRKFDLVITVEDGCIQGGFGSAVVEYMAESAHSAKVIRLGIPDSFVEHGSQAELYAECKYDASAIAATALELLGVSQAKATA